MVSAKRGTSRKVAETNKDTVRRYVERFNAGDLEGLREVFADDALVFGVLGWGKISEIINIDHTELNGDSLK